MPLPPESLSWLRDLAQTAGQPAPADLANLEQMAQLTPAWIAPYAVLHPDGPWDRAEFDCPQIVDMDFPTMALDRAEWVGSALYLGLAPAYEDPKVYTTFRIVGVEPRQWDIAGIDGAMVDAKSNGVVVRVPLKRAPMSFTPSSY